MEVTTVNSPSNNSVQLITDDNLQSIQQQKPKGVMSVKSINNNSNTNSLSCTNSITNSNSSPTQNNFPSLSMNVTSNNNNDILYNASQDQTNPELNNDQTDLHIKNNNLVTPNAEVKELMSQLVIKIQSELQSLQLQQHQPTITKTKLNTKPEDESASQVTIKSRLEEQVNNLNAIEPKQSSPISIPDDEATCDLVIDSELPSSNEAQDVSSNHEETQSVHFGSVLQKEHSKEDDQQHKNNQSNAKSENETKPIDRDNKIVYSETNDTQVEMELETQNDESQPEENSLTICPSEADAKDLQNDVNKRINLTGKDSKTSSIEGVSDDIREEKSKDMVTLRNLEITPPPQPPSNDEILGDEKTLDSSELNEKKVSTRKRRKRSRTVTPDSASDLNESNESAGRSKRQRRQTQLFQVGEFSPVVSPTVSVSSSARSRSSKTTSRTTTRESKKASTSSSVSTTERDTVPATQPPHTIIQHSNIPQDVIFYEKNDYLAIRNEEDSFYLCQLTENVKVNRPFIRVRWLDTKDNKSYFLTSLYDQVPQLSILMPVTLNKMKSDSKGDQLFTLGDQDRDNILERLKRSLNAVSAINSSQQSSSDG